MDNLPGFALDGIFAYIDPKTLCCSVSQLSQSARTYLVRDQGYVHYFAGLANLPKEISITYEQFREAVITLFHTGRKPIDVKITGFSTTGGMDSEFMQYWVGNLFDRELPAYCTDENQNNTVCAGVLSVFTESKDSADLLHARSEAAFLVRNSRFLRNIAGQILKLPDSPDPLTPLEESLFVDICARNPAILLVGKHLSPEERTQKIEGLAVIARSLVKAQTETLMDMRVDPERKHLFEAKIFEKDRAEQMDVFFCINRVVISRKGQFTCPLETFVVFVSSSFLPVTSEEFTKYDNLLQEQDVARLYVQGLPPTVPLDYEGAQLREFSRTNSVLQPVLWGKFTQRTTDIIEVRLNAVFSGKFLYIKLINSEDRMREMGDMHDYPNIDVDYLGVQGAVVSLDYL